MTQHTVKVPNGFLTYSSIDAEFEFEGKKTFMEVHSYCGPTFYTLNEDGEEVWLEPDDNPRWKDLWKVYTEWANIPEYNLKEDQPLVYTCSCKGKKIKPDINTPVGSLHLKGCELLKSYLFYYEEAINAYTPVTEEVSSIISTENLEEGESQEIKFIRFDMTEDEYNNLEID